MTALPPFVVFLSDLAAALLLFAAAAWRPVAAVGRLAAGLAALPLLLAGVVTVYVFGEDSYRRHGISRWDAYRSPGGALGTLYVVSVVLLVLCAVVLAATAAARRERVFRMTAILGALAVLFVVAPTVIGFSAN